jgi:hypothetical protein
MNLKLLLIASAFVFILGGCGGNTPTSSPTLLASTSNESNSGGNTAFVAEAASSDVSASDWVATDPAWETEQAIETGTGEAKMPYIAFDHVGNAIAIWVQNDGVSDKVYSNRYSPIQGWGMERPINTGGNRAILPKVAFDKSGNALALWFERDVPNKIYQLHVSRYTPANGWEAAKHIGTGNDLFRGQEYDYARYLTTGNGFLVPAPPQVAFDSRGNAIVIWEKYHTSSDPSLYSNLYSPVHGWDYPRFLAPRSRNAQIAINSKDVAAVIWQQHPYYDSSIGTQYPSIYIAGYFPGRGWRDTGRISEEGMGIPQIAFDNGTALWAGISGIYDRTDEVYSAGHTAARVWKRPELLGGASRTYGPHWIGDSISIGARLAMAKNGNALAIWHSYTNSYEGQIVGRRYTPSAGWGSAMAITTNVKAYYPQFDIAMNDYGDAFAIWTEGATPDTLEVHGNRFTPDGKLERSQMIAAGISSGSNPRIAVDAFGNAMAVWVQNHGSEKSIVVRRFSVVTQKQQ